MPVRISAVLILVAAILPAATACGDGTSPSRTLVATWDLVSFSDHGVVGTTTGTMTFRSNGTLEVIGTVTYPGEPTDSLTFAGTYQANARTVTLTIGSTTGTWSLTWQDDSVILTLQGPQPTNVIVLASPR